MQANATDRAAAANGKLIATLGSILATTLAGGWIYIGKVDASRISTLQAQDQRTVELEERERRHVKRMRELRDLEQRIMRQDALLLEMSSLLVGHVSNPKLKLSKPLSLIRAEQRLRED